mmetsp:Transcript_19985/g.51033  ORF Transcript_19985/g.51033 Transcript_19985/m.51033 type:complete len:83 (-) Transcript_19985:132-380(-)
MVTFHRKKNLPYFEISAKSNYNFEKPFLKIARSLVGDSELRFEGELALAPSEVELNPDMVRQQEEDLQRAQAEPLPEDDDDF